jgi:hypothetical protein
VTGGAVVVDEVGGGADVVVVVGTAVVDVGGGVPPPLTITWPCMSGWNRQWYETVPGDVKVKEYFDPGVRSGELSGSPVTLCVVLEDSSLDQTTVSPTLTVIDGGLNWRFLIDTGCVAADAVGAARPALNMLSATAEVAAIRRDVRSRRSRNLRDVGMRGEYEERTLFPSRPGPERQ